MIAPPNQGQGLDSGLPSGTPNNPITIRALNEGKVLIDGQFSRAAVYFRFNTDIRVIGVNVCCGRPGIYANRTKRMSFLRVIAWDQHRPGDPPDVSAGNPITVDGTGTEDTLFEDCAAFGMGQRMFRNAFRSNRVTVRRCWFRFEGHEGTEPSSTFNLLRDSGAITVENSLFTWDASRGGAHQQTGIVVGGTSGENPPGSPVRLLGSIVYVRPDSANNNPFGIHFHAGSTTATLNNVVVYTAPLTGTRPIQLDTPGTQNNNTASNITTIRHPNAPASRYSTFRGNNRQEYTSLSGINIYTGTGARVCKRYFNGSLTNEPLWPFPMDQRIKEAIDIARATQLNPQSPLLIGNSLTAEIEEIFGPIPSSCHN
jgi:hypothetical protein